MIPIEAAIAIMAATEAVPEDFPDEQSINLFLARQLYAYVMNQELQ